MADDQREKPMPGPVTARWWWRPRFYMVFYRIPTPTITGAAYEKRLRDKCHEAITSGAVDAGTGGMFDRQIDADLGNDTAMISDQARRYEQRAGRVLHRHRLRKDKAARRAEHVSDDLIEEETKLGDLDKQVEARRESAPAGPARTQDGKRAERNRRLRSSLRNVGDSPFAVVFAWMMLIALMGVDVPLLYTMLGQADIESGELTNWVIATACAVALAAVAGYACELLLRWLDHRVEVHGISAAVLYLTWATGIGLATWFRLTHPIRSGAGESIFPDSSSAETAPGAGGDIGMALLLSGLLMLTGAVAMGIIVLNHDLLQKQRRTSARRRWRLRRLLRHVRHVENHHDKAVAVQQTVIDGILGQATDAVKQVFYKATSLKEDVRHWMANALGDPAATSALTNHPDDDQAARGGGA